MKNLSLLKAVGMAAALVLVGGGCVTGRGGESTETKPEPISMPPVYESQPEETTQPSGGSANGGGSGDLDVYEDPVSNPTQP